MAEGHSIIRWARLLAPLVGAPLEQVRLPERLRAGEDALRGQHLRRIGTHGKHLLFEWSNDLTLHTHALMTGGWQLVRRGREFRPIRGTVTVRFVTASHEAVFTNGPVVELLTPEERASHRKLRALGPDLLHDPFDLEGVLRRMRRPATGQREVGDVLLDQTVVAGIGNIFKSEALHLAGLHPATPVDRLSDATLTDLLGIARALMERAARGSGPVVTVARVPGRGAPSERHHVYMRHGRPCLRCGARIEAWRQGAQRRTTYRCPSCQPDGTGRLRLFD